MSRIPVVRHHSPCCSSRDQQRAESLAAKLRAGSRRLQGDDRFSALRTRALDEVPTLHVDDFSGIGMTPEQEDISIFEDRARMRADDGDMIICHGPPVAGYEEYCRGALGLGEVRWLAVNRADRRAGGLMTSAWIDRSVRHQLLAAIRKDDLRSIHPFHSTFNVWAVASLLQRAAGRPLEVLGPPPALSHAANDKIWFHDVVQQLLGTRWVPESSEAYNFSTVARLVRRYAETGDHLVIKLPDAVGGWGNLLLDASDYRGRDLGGIRAAIKPKLRRLGWEGDVRLLVGRWEESVLATPSAQTWIPPLGVAPPVVEDLYEQIVELPSCRFLGNVPAELPARVVREAVDASWLLALCFQHLGWVGRCSFDLILTGSDLESSRIEFVECNGRWGGTSLPMTLMNRLFGDARSQPHACRHVQLVPKSDGASRANETVLDFCTVESRLAPRLWTASATAGGGSGDLILICPGELARGRIGLIALGNDRDDALARLATVRWPPALGDARPSGELRQALSQ